MLEMLFRIHPVGLAFLAGIFTWLMTAAGASIIFLKRGISQRWLDFMLGLAAGVMIAASFWSLLAPAIEMAYDAGSRVPWAPAAVGFLLGMAFLRGVDRVLPHLHIGLPDSQKEGIATSLPRSTLLVLAITLHNIPEGLAVGVAFGSVSANHLPQALLPALVLALGIGLQNVPEGLAVAGPLAGEGLSKARAFWYGQMSAIVEPIAAVIGSAALFLAAPLLPYALAFAAGAMIFVVVEEVIPESQRNGYGDLATTGTMIGFVLMMVLDVALSP